MVRSFVKPKPPVIVIDQSPLVASLKHATAERLAVPGAALAVVQADKPIYADKRVSLGAAQMDGLARLAVAQAEGGGVSHGMALPISAMAMAQQAAIIFASPS